MNMIRPRRGLLANIPAIAATTMAPAAAKALSGLPAPASDDPIFAAIESHTQAATDLNTIPGDLRWEMTAPEWDAFWTASETEPTTEGAVALLEYLLSPYLGESSMLCHAFELWAGNGYEPSEDDEYITAPEWQASIIKAMRKMSGAQS